MSWPAVRAAWNSSTSDAQVGRYRSFLAGRRVLVLLDDARDSWRVRPLVPGAPGCMALITSRNDLSSLVSREGALPITLDVLSDGDCRSMLARRLGRERVAAEPEATDEIVARCAGLPLSLAAVAAWAATHPRRPLSALTDQIREVSPDVLATGELPASW